jgi:hypothetical protein
LTHATGVSIAIFANPLIDTARELDVKDEFGVDLANTVDALETTTIDQSLSVFP